MNVEQALTIDQKILDLSPKEQAQVETLQSWQEIDERTAERSKKLRNKLMGAVALVYSGVAYARFGHDVPLPQLTPFITGAGVLVNCMTKQHYDAKSSEEAAKRSDELAAALTGTSKMNDESSDSEAFSIPHRTLENDPDIVLVA